MEGKVQALCASGADSTKIAGLKGLISELVGTSKGDELCQFLTALFSIDSIGQQIQRPVVLELTNQLGALAEKGDAHVDFVRMVAECAIERIQDNRNVFEEANNKLRQMVGNIMSNAEEYIEAARCLSNIDTESDRLTEAEKAEHYVRITELFLEEDETVDAERFVNRASQYVYNANKVVQVRHRVCYARILDSKRKFLDAAHRYYQLSMDTLKSSDGEVEGDETFVAEEDLLHLLSKSVTCALLASAGPQRERMLNLLYKDERTKNFPTFAILDKMYSKRILTKPEMRAFEQTLLPHQKAILADGSTILDRAVLEHNMIAISNLYANISFVELGKLLGIDGRKALLICSAMAKEERLKGTIDQVAGFLIYEQETDALNAFDVSIGEFCGSVNNLVEDISKAHPSIVLDL